MFTDCFKTNCTGCYTGTWHRTQTGRECQRWDSQTPHKQKATDGEKFKQDQSVTGAQNYCRDPTESGMYLLLSDMYNNAVTVMIIIRVGLYRSFGNFPAILVQEGVPMEH
jgi:hypothetical protein